MRRRRRRWVERRHGLGQVAGEDHPAARLTAAQVVRARQRIAALRTTLTAEAARCGVPVNTLSQAVNGTTWRHLETPPVRTEQAWPARRAYCMRRRWTTRKAGR